MTLRIRSLLVLVPFAVLCAVMPSCSPSGADDGPDVKIAFFQDLSVPDPVDLVSPSFLALDMVVQRRLEGQGVTAEVVQFDTRGDAGEAIEMAKEVAAEGSFVLAVAAPFWHEPAEVGRILAEAGVPTISLSPVSASPWVVPTAPPGEAGALWRRLVPDRTAEASLLTEIAGRRSAEGVAQPTCLVEDGSEYGRGLVGQVEAGLGPWPSTRHRRVGRDRRHGGDRDDRLQGRPVWETPRRGRESSRGRCEPQGPRADGPSTSRATRSRPRSRPRPLRATASWWGRSHARVSTSRSICDSRAAAS